MTTKQGYVTLGSLIDQPGGGYITLGEAMSEEGIQGVGSDLNPVNITSITLKSDMALTTKMVTESGAGVQASDYHRVMRAVEIDDGYHLRLTEITDLSVGEMVVVNPRVEEGQLKFDLSPVQEVKPAAIEEIYEVVVDSEDGIFLCNGLLNQGTPINQGTPTSSTVENV